MDIANYIKNKRNEEGLNQKQLAKACGVGLRFVRDLEQGKPTVRIDKVNVVLKLFGKQLGPIDLDEKTMNEEINEGAKK